MLLTWLSSMALSAWANFFFAVIKEVRNENKGGIINVKNAHTLHTEHFCKTNTSYMHTHILSKTEVNDMNSKQVI